MIRRALLFVGLLLSANAFGQNLEREANQALGLTSSDVQSLRVLGTPQAGIQAALRLDGAWSQLVLTADSVRSSSFELLAHREDGTYEPVDPGPVVTLRGVLEGEPGSQVAGSMLSDGLYARIRLADDREFWLQPLTGVVAPAVAGDYVLYETGAILPTGFTCGSALLAGGLGTPGGAVATGPGSIQAFGGGGLYTAELACDADYEYYLDYGSSMTNVSNRIQTVIGTMNMQYEGEVGITHDITTIIVRTSSNQPYTSSDASTLLNQFRSHWNSSQGGVTRDVAQLFSGKSINGGTIGIAWVGVICNSSYGYGMVESDFNGNFASATDLSAHELGHNWSAPHCSCTSYTMNPYITTSNTFNPNSTRGTITSFRDSRSCLDVGGGGGSPPGPAGQPAPSNGASSVSADADLDWSAGSGATSYDVYFGTDSTPDGGEFQGSQTGTGYALGTLAYSTTYYWRIDAVNVDGTTTGSVWSFTTEADPGGGGGETIIFADGFNGTTSSSWSYSGRLRPKGNAAYAGSAGIRLKRSQYMEVTVDASSFTGLRLECARRTRNLDGSERLEISCNGTVLETLTGNTSWTTSDLDLSPFAGSSAVTVRFEIFANRNNERGDVDEVSIVGTN